MNFITFTSGGSIFTGGQVSAQRPVSAGESSACPVPTGDEVQTSGAQVVAPGPSRILAPDPTVLAGQSLTSGFGALPAEGKVASLLESTPAPGGALSEEKALAMRDELELLDQLGYLGTGQVDFPKPSTPEHAFEQIEKGKPVFWRETPNSDPITILGWPALEKTAREARERTYR